jgi:2',3'-cyclic-nucleotide 2'-phosphodiesterase (5'-nucleotidase family)
MMKKSVFVRGWFAAAIVAAMALPGLAETKTVLVLHTNDLHARIRPSRFDLGGMPYISGYIHQVREGRKDVLVLDAGDVTEKGDMLSYMTHNSVMYEAMNRAGYDAATPGNHDMRDPLYLGEGVKAAPNVSFVCMNCIQKEGIPRFEASKIFTVNGVRVAVIGLTVKTGDESDSTLNDGDCMKRLATEVDRVGPLSDVQILLCHLGSKACLKISKNVPELDLFVSGHTHELLKKPVRTDSGALIVQAGEYANHVGRVELKVDVESHKVEQADVSVVDMDQKVVPCDKELTALIETREKAVCPEAGRVIARCDENMPGTALGQLVAEALHRSAGTDVSLFNAPYVFRADLPKGDVNIGDIFLAGGFRGYKMVTTSLTGKEIESYLAPGLTKGKPNESWHGFDAKIERADGKWKVTSSLDPNKKYSVVIAALEWEKQYAPDNSGAEGKVLEPCTFTFTDSVVDYITAKVPKEISLNAYVKSMPKNGCEIQ